MKLQHNPNKWSCLPTAFAMVLDLRVEDLIQRIGHDGSEIIHPDLPEPECRRAFHIQEMVQVALKEGHTVTLLEPRPTLAASDTHIQQYTDHCFGDWLKEAGVFTGHSHFSNLAHAVAWNGELIFDPVGVRYGMENFDIREFWMVRKCKS